MANSYKALKEEFVSNLSGGSISEINVVTAVAPVGPSVHPSQAIAYILGIIRFSSLPLSLANC